MNLRSKKALAARTLGVGKGRIRFVRLDEVKEAITSQDILSLKAKGAIEIKQVKGRRANIARTTRRGAGKIKKKIKNTKRVYVYKTRKLRAAVKNLQRAGSVTREEYKQLRSDIRGSKIKNKAHLNDHLNEMRK
jgi:ribosomal protein L19E